MPATTANNRNASETPNAWDAKELGCLWKKVSKGGESYFTGVIDLKKAIANLNVKTLEELLNLDLICFNNKRKTKDTHPDVRIYFSEPREGGKTASAPAARRQAPAAAPAPVADSSELI